jgi:hypothetical protein
LTVITLTDHDNHPLPNSACVRVTWQSINNVFDDSTVDDGTAHKAACPILQIRGFPKMGTHRNDEVSEPEILIRSQPEFSAMLESLKIVLIQRTGLPSEYLIG